MLDYSVAIIVTMTGEKLYAVCFPLKAHQEVEFNRKIYIKLLTMLVFCCTINSHFLFSLTLVAENSVSSFYNKSSSRYICTNIKWDNFYQNYWIFIDATVYSFLPFILIAVFNISIITNLTNEKRRRSTLQNLSITKIRKSANVNSSMLKYQTGKLLVPEIESLNGNTINSDLTNNSRTISLIPKLSHLLDSSVLTSDTFQRRMAIVETNHNICLYKIANKYKNGTREINKLPTIMLILNNISFCILTMPIVILQIVNQAKNVYPNPDNRHKLIDEGNIFNLLKAIFELLQFLNHSCNFFLYCLSGERYRREAWDFFTNIYKHLFCSFK